MMFVVEHARLGHNGDVNMTVFNCQYQMIQNNHIYARFLLRIICTAE